MSLSLLVVLLPVVGAALALLLRSERRRPYLLPVVGTLHLVFSLAAVLRRDGPAAWGWLFLDAPGRLVLLLVSALFAVVSFYSVAYLRTRTADSNRIFTACLLLFLATMTFIPFTHHLGLMWVAVEAAALASTPLLYYDRNQRSLEATWKYLIVGSVGIALALLGSLFLGYAAAHGGEEPSLLFADLVEHAPGFSVPWLHAAFVLLAVGYGTKMGLAPMHTWKPDAYGEAPGLVGALLSGGMTSCAFLALVRVHAVLGAAGEGEFAARVLVLLGIFSMALAAVFMVQQRDLKRLLAYSSVEHMGILALGLGLGGVGAFGAMLHMVNNGIVKGALFLSAGNIHRAYASKDVGTVAGALHRVPWSAGALVAGFLAITGSPPFGPFVSEFTVLGAAVGAGRYFVAGAMLVFLLVAFLGMGAAVLAVVHGEVSPSAGTTMERDRPLTVVPLLVLLALSLVLGLALPPGLEQLVREAGEFAGGRP